MKAIHYFQVETDPFENIEALKKELSKHKKFKFEDYNPFDEQRQLFLKHGITKIINPEYLEFLGTPRDDRGLFIKTFQKFLDNVIKTDSLIIIDSYIFPKNYDTDYPDLLIDILKKYIPQLTKLTFITKSKFDQPLQSDIFNKIKNINTSISVDLKHTDLFHDRFWLSSPDSKGSFIGTSLNGLGKKFTLIDYIDIDDVKQIFTELKTENILH
ncbi:MAG: hypothetical protein ABIJ97_02550 [Bacteroidota bacterium]